MTTKADFSPIETPWGVQHLHKRKIVWYAHYPLADVSVGTWDRPKKVKGKWVAYYTSNDSVSDKPWCQGNWAITQRILLTEEEAIKECDNHLLHVDSMRNPL